MPYNKPFSFNRCQTYFSDIATYKYASLAEMLSQMSKSKACEGVRRWECHLAKVKACSVCLPDPSESNAAELMDKMLYVRTQQCSN